MKKRTLFQKHRKAQIFSTLTIIFVFCVCVWAVAIYLKERPKLEKQIVMPISILDVYNQEQTTNYNYFKTIYTSVQQSYIDIIKNYQFINSECIIQDGFIYLDERCYILDDADNILSRSIQDKINLIYPELKISISSDKISVETDIKNIYVENRTYFFPITINYTFKPSFSYPFYSFNIISFLKIKTAINKCKTLSTVEEIKSCLIYELKNIEIIITEESGKKYVTIEENTKYIPPELDTPYKPTIKIAV